MKIRKYAAIDVGSNAIRLLVNNVIEQEGRETRFTKNSLIRVPVRLGEDAFIHGMISTYNTGRMIRTMKAFKHLMSVMNVERYKACGTSAMREASNGQDVKERIKEESGVEVHLIDGKEEATIIASTDLGPLMGNGRWYLYMDVGGGSTEFSLICDGEIQESRSFRIGTVRMINNMVDDAIWKELEEWIRQTCSIISRVAIIGSGGNINKLHKLSGRREDEPLSYIWLNSQYQYLKNMTYEERILRLGLNPDRADVILPAAKIYLQAAKWSGARKIHVPKIGLSDGIIKTLYYSDQKQEK